MLSRAVARERRVEQEIVRAEQRLAEQIETEAADRARELERTLARARADSVSLLQEEERRIAENHRALVAEREHASGVKLVAALAETQQKVEQRLAEWRQDLDRTMARLQQELARVGDRQRELIGEAEARIAVDAERIAAESEEQRAAILRLREDLERTTRDALVSAAAELETHSQERRRAIEELAERLRRREHTIAEHIEREEADAVQRIQTGFADIERRQVEALERAVERSSTRFAEATSQLFADEIKAAREGAAGGARATGRRDRRAADREADLPGRRWTRAPAGRRARSARAQGGGGRGRLSPQSADVRRGRGGRAWNRRGEAPRAHAPRRGDPLARAGTPRFGISVGANNSGEGSSKRARTGKP